LEEGEFGAESRNVTRGEVLNNREVGGIIGPALLANSRHSFDEANQHVNR